MLLRVRAYVPTHRFAADGRVSAQRLVSVFRRSAVMSAAADANNAAATPFVIHQSRGLSRTGVLHTATGSLPTPNAFFYTKKGNPAHLSQDQLPKLPLLQGLHVPISEFVQAPGVEGIKKCNGKLHEYVQLPRHIIYMSVRDPLVDGLGTSNDNGTNVLSTHGTARVSPTQYANLTHAYQPDIIASISDEISSATVTNRARKSSQRSVMWVDEMQKARAAAAKADPANPSKALFFASVQGGADLDQRLLSCEQYSLRTAAAEASGDVSQRIDGFVIGGLGSGEDAEKRAEIVSTIVRALPSSKPRILAASSAFSGAPDEVLRGIAAGVDLFEVQYPHQLTLLGQASVFEFDQIETEPASDALPVTKLHLRDPKYAHDASPLLRGCTCFTCTNHTRAYLHHLLDVHEMLAPVLLDLHNLHHYTRFLETVRGKLASNEPDAFERFHQQFLRRFLPSAEVVPLADAPVHRNQVGRAMLGPFAPALVAVNGFIVRRMLPKDAPQMAAIIRSVLTDFGCAGPGFALHDPEMDDLYRMYETHNLPPPAADAMTDVASAPAAPLPPLRTGYFVVTRADDDTVVLGGGGFAPLIGADGTVAEVRKLYFMSELRGQGLGRALLGLVLDATRQIGFKQVYIETVDKMKAAMKLYSCNGFKSIDGHMGNTGHQKACNVFMCRDL